MMNAVMNSSLPSSFIYTSRHSSGFFVVCRCALLSFSSSLIIHLLNIRFSFGNRFFNLDHTFTMCKNWPLRSNPLNRFLQTTLELDRLQIWFPNTFRSFLGLQMVLHVHLWRILLVLRPCLNTCESMHDINVFRLQLSPKWVFIHPKVCLR